MSLIKIMPGRGTIQREKLEAERKAEMEKTTPKLPDRIAEHGRLRDKRVMLTRCHQDLRLNKIYLTQLNEVPDSVKRHPPRAQSAYMYVYNACLRRYGDVHFAIKAGWHAVKTTVEYLKNNPEKNERYQTLHPVTKGVAT